MANLVQVIKKIAREERLSSKPCDFLFGKIMSINPLKIQVDQKLIIPKDFFVFTANAMEQTYKIGDEIILLMKSGGQKYLFLGKIGSGEIVNSAD